MTCDLPGYQVIHNELTVEQVYQLMAFANCAVRGEAFIYPPPQKKKKKKGLFLEIWHKWVEMKVCF